MVPVIRRAEMLAELVVEHGIAVARHMEKTQLRRCRHLFGGGTFDPTIVIRPVGQSWWTNARLNLVIIW